ncbi:hypothetical protein PCASD_16362 [Puccinia coronata f. sp. avenae]|uniref:Uncharacterized protein n=1 Tax=Puccinia coronata f. sp. avenae TaxID=200324 RepID=A0A2N5SW47_9BASI|nr:hypothetical protein PCASD_16362 [Puccinia coronata f. sp. avenae]
MSDWIFLVVGPFLTSRHLRHNRLVRRKDKSADLHVAKTFMAKCFTVKPQHQPEKTSGDLQDAPSDGSDCHAPPQAVFPDWPAGC